MATIKEIAKSVKLDNDRRLRVVQVIYDFMKKKKIPAEKLHVMHRGEHRKGGKKPHEFWGGLDIGAFSIGNRAMQDELIEFAASKGVRVIDERDSWSDRVQKRQKGKGRGVIHFDLRHEAEGKKHKGRILREEAHGTWDNPRTHVDYTDITEEFKNRRKGPKAEDVGRRETKSIMASRAKAANKKIKSLIKPKGYQYSKKEKEEKAKAYQELLNAGGKSKYASYWLRFLPKKEKSPHKRELEHMSVPVEQTEEFKHFNRDLTDETKNAPPQETELHPAMEAQKQRQLSIEGSAIPFKNEDIELKKQEQIEEYVPSHTPMESLPEEMKVEESMEEKVSDPQDLIVDYKKRQVKGFKKGGSVLKEPELPEDPEEQKRAMGETDIISEAVEDKVEGTVPQDSWRLKPEEPVEVSDPEKPSEVPDPEDLSKMGKSEISKKIRENMEVTSEPGSDIVRLQPKSGQGKRVKRLKSELQDRKIEDSLVKAGLRETETMVDKPEVKVDLKEKVTVEEPVEPKAFTLQDYIQQTLQRDEDARQILQTELAAAKEAENKIQKVEPYRFWNNMSTPAKIVAGIGMLISGYAAKDSPAGLQAVMNVIDGAVNADIQAQKLTQDQQLVVAKEATRRAQAAVNKYQALATSPTQKAKLMELAQALEAKRVGVEKKQQLMALRQYVMNKAREGKLHMVPPSLMRMVYPKEEMKRIDTMRNDYEKERKDRKIQPILSAYRRMHRLIDTKEDVSGMDDIAIVFSFMKMLDPNSVVRETEFETAANAGPRAKYFARQWNRFITGGRFTQADRRGFLKSALQLVKPALDEEKQIQRKYVTMARRYGYPAAFIIPPSTRYFDLPGTKDEAAIRKIMKEQGKTRDEAESIHHHVAKKVKPRYVMRKGVKYPVK